MYTIHICPAHDDHQHICPASVIITSSGSNDAHVRHSDGSATIYCDFRF